MRPAAMSGKELAGAKAPAERKEGNKGGGGSRRGRREGEEGEKRKREGKKEREEKKREKRGGKKAGTVSSSIRKSVMYRLSLNVSSRI